MTPSYAHRKDAVHSDLSDVGRDLGFYVRDTSAVGPTCIPGFPDAIWVLHDTAVLVEYKSKGGKLTKSEKKFHAEYPGPIAIVRDLDDALRLREKWRG